MKITFWKWGNSTEIISKKHWPFHKWNRKNNVTFGRSQAFTHHLNEPNSRFRFVFRVRAWEELMIIIAVENERKGNKNETNLKNYGDRQILILERLEFIIFGLVIVEKCYAFELDERKAVWEGAFVTLAQELGFENIFHFPFEWNAANK